MTSISNATKARVVLVILAVAVLSTCSTETPTGKHFDHIVVVFEENKSATDVRSLPYLTILRQQGLEFTQSRALYRPSQPNYIAFFSGLPQADIALDNNDDNYSVPNLYTRFYDRGVSFLSYAQSMPNVGYRGTSSGNYVRKHNPVASFTTVPDSVNRAFSDFPTNASGFASLPAVSFVIPDLQYDMHDGTPEAADTWLNANLGAYAQWALTNRSLLILTFDEPQTSPAATMDTPILTLFTGAGLIPGRTVDQPVTHYTMLKFLLDEFGAKSLGLDAGEAEIIFP